MGRKVLTESCVIQCCHGGTVDHPSSDPIRVIGGLKPNFCVDILDAPISGCPIPITPCTKVAAISDAMTETNVTGTNGTYALDLSACTTDQGATLKVASRANKNSASAVKASTSSSVEGIEPTKEKEKIAKELLVKEQYNLYLLRQSQDINFTKIYKPLRGSRAFADILTFYGNMNTHPSIKEKVIPFTLAFVYIKLSTGIVNEYRILSKGALYSETFRDIQYKDENTTRDYIPLYDGESIDIYYSNIQLSKNTAKRDKILNKLVSVKFKPTDTNKDEKSFFLKDSSSIDSNIISEDTFLLQKQYDPIKDGQAYPLDITMCISDAVGQAEDMLNIYEWRYKMNFCKNDTQLNQLKKKNAYTYAVSDKMDYFYVSKEEQDNYDTNINKLKTLYRKLADEICKGKLSSLIIKNEDEIIPLNHIINPSFDTAVNYFNEVSHINKSFFRNIFEGEKHTRKEARHGIHKHPYNEEQFVVTKDGLSCKYDGIYTLKESQEKNNDLKDEYKNKKETIKVSDVNYGYLVLDNPKDTKYQTYQKNPPEMLALLVFAICFSKEYEKEVKKAGLYDTAKDFYHTLKDTAPLPAIGDENIQDVKKLIDTQDESYAPICNKTNKLLEQFESIDTINKEFSFDNTSIKSPSIVFSDLYLPSELKSFTISLHNPKELLLKANQLLQEVDFKKMIEAYISIVEFDDEIVQKEYFNTSLGLLYTFISNRTMLDIEANTSSPFNTNTKHILDFTEHIVQLKNEITNEILQEEVFSLPINEHHTKALHSHIGHAIVPTLKNEDGFTIRESNAKAFLDKHTVKEPLKDLDLSNLLAQDFDISEEAKTKLKNYYTALVKIEGYASKVGNVMEEYKKAKLQSDSLNMFSDEGDDKITHFQNSPKYKNLLSSIQTLSFLVAGVNTINAAINYKKVKVKDIFPLITDVYTTISSFGKALPKTKDAVVEYVQKYMGEANLKKMLTLKIMAKVGILSVAINAIYDVAQLEDDDIDGTVATIAKNITVISLLLAPLYLMTVPGIGWIAALGIVVVEVAWEFYFKDIFVDTPLESYIMKSLLFQQSNYEKTISSLAVVAPFSSFLGYVIYKYIDDQPYETTLFKEAVKEKELIPGFGSLKEVQNFIGENHDKYEEEFNNALQYELNALQAVAFGYKVEILDAIKKDYDKMLQTLQTKIKIPKRMLQNNIQVMLKIDSHYKTIHESPQITLGKIPDMPDDFSYDIIERKVLRDGKMIGTNDINKIEAENLAKKGISLLIVNRDITLKYNIQLEAAYNKSYHSYEYGYTTPASLSLIIEKIKLAPLETQERTILEDAVSSRKDKEKNIPNQKESI